MCIMFKINRLPAIRPTMSILLESELPIQYFFNPANMMNTETILWSKTAWCECVYLSEQHPLWLQVKTHPVTLVIQEVLQP